MERARGHQRLLAGLALGLLALTAELAGRSLTHRLDVGRHVGRVSYAGADYYPFLLAAVKFGVALMLARVAWRFARAHAAASAAHRVAAALGARRRRRTARVRIELSPRLWLLSFVGTASIYLVQADAERAAGGNLTLLGPWLHSSALPVFAVLSVLVAVLYRPSAAGSPTCESLAADAVALRTPARRARTAAGAAPPALRFARTALPLRSRVRVPPAAADGVAAGTRPRLL